MTFSYLPGSLSIPFLLNVIDLNWKKFSIAWLTCFLELKIFHSKSLLRNRKGDSLSGQSPGSKVGMVKQTIQAQEFILESPLLYVVAHCRVKEWRFCDWLICWLSLISLGDAKQLIVMYSSFLLYLLLIDMDFALILPLKGSRQGRNNVPPSVRFLRSYL